MACEHREEKIVPPDGELELDSSQKDKGRRTRQPQLVGHSTGIHNVPAKYKEQTCWFPLYDVMTALSGVW